MPFKSIYVFLESQESQAVLLRGAELARQCSVPLTALIWAEQDLSSNLPHVDRFVSLPAVPVGNYAAEWIAGSLAEFLRDTTSFLLLLPANDCCTEVAARLSVRLGCSFLPDINGSLSISEGSVIGARTLLSGQAREVLQSNTPSVIATIVSSGEELKSGMSLVDSVQRVILKPDPIETLVRVLAVEQECGSGMPALSSARIVVAGGAGMGGLAGFSLLRELCNAIGASLAASRAAVNNGWIGPEFQVGLSGKIITPEVYIACGISGSVQHQAGMRGAHFIVAINRDSKSPIFRICDLGLVGDVFSILPLLVARLRE